VELVNIGYVSVTQAINVIGMPIEDLIRYQIDTRTRTFRVT